MNAKEARAMVENYNKKVEEAREERVNKFLETTVAKAIEENSRDGYDIARFTPFVDNQDTELMIKKLKELGYKVEQVNNRFIFVEW